MMKEAHKQLFTLNFKDIPSEIENKITKDVFKDSEYKTVEKGLNDHLNWNHYPKSDLETYFCEVNEKRGLVESFDETKWEPFAYPIFPIDLKALAVVSIIQTKLELRGFDGLRFSFRSKDGRIPKNLDLHRPLLNRYVYFYELQVGERFKIPSWFDFIEGVYFPEEIPESLGFAINARQLKFSNLSKSQKRYLFLGFAPTGNTMIHLLLFEGRKTPIKFGLVFWTSSSQDMSDTIHYSGWNVNYEFEGHKISMVTDLSSSPATTMTVEPILKDDQTEETNRRKENKLKISLENFRD